MAWPPGFVRVPNEEWTSAPIDELALGYDRVGKHGWYANLDPTAAHLDELLTPGSVMLDYSGGTGLLVRRVLERIGARDVGIVNVDSSPKFLRLALERSRGDDRVAFRLIRWLKEAKRLQYVDEVLGAPLLARGVDALVSANAIHLYDHLDATLASWARIVKPGGHVLVQSGNIQTQRGGEGRIIDDTVEEVHRRALEIVREDPALARYRDAADDAKRQTAHEALRQKFFLPPRPTRFYLDALRGAGFDVVSVETQEVEVDADEWAAFLGVYHEGVLGWVGGSLRVEGHEPTRADVDARRELIQRALRSAVGGRAFTATWTHIACRH